MKSKKISHLLVGTNNKGKLREIKALLPKNIKIFSTSDFNLKSPKENGILNVLLYYTRAIRFVYQMTLA